MGSFIKLPSDIINYAPIYQFKCSKNKFENVPDVTGENAEEMPAAQELLAVYRSFQDVLQSYASLISYDGERMTKIVKAFVETDRG